MITDPLSCTYGNEIESKGVQFPGQNAPVKIRGGGYPDISKTVAFCHKNTKIRMRSDEHHHRQSKSPPSGPECREKSGTFLRSRATNLNYNKLSFDKGAKIQRQRWKLRSKVYVLLY